MSYQFQNSQVLWNQTDIHIWNILFHHQNNFLHFCMVHCHMVELEEEKTVRIFKLCCKIKTYTLPWTKLCLEVYKRIWTNLFVHTRRLCKWVNKYMRKFRLCVLSISLHFYKDVLHKVSLRTSKIIHFMLLPTYLFYDYMSHTNL